MKERISKNKYIFNIYFRAVVIIICCITALSIESNITSAKTNNKFDEYSSVCEEALKTIQGFNQDKLEVYIGDIYNVVDIEGNLDGYSLGYFVDDIPYGYAIYDLSSESIREFVFQQNVNNLYVELEEKAEEDTNVDDDNLINGVVYDGGLGYFTYDNDANVTSIQEYDSENNESIEYYEDNAEQILNSKYVNFDDNSLPTSKNMNELCDSLDYWKICDPDNYIAYNIIPDSGLTMITQEYTSDKIKRYCCGIHSLVGCLCWMGRLYNGNILDTYNKFWDDCGVEGKYDGNITAGGVSRTNVVNALNNYFQSLNIKTRAYQDFDVTYNDIINSISGISSAEKAPFYLGLTIYRDNILESSHAVTGVSYYYTSSKKYVGIYNGWYLDSNDNQVGTDGVKTDVNNGTSYQSVRYIDFDELVNSSNISMSAIMFKDVQSGNIKEVNKSYVSGNNIELSCYVPNGTKYVFFPTWTVVGNGTDVVWHSGNIQYGTVASVSIDLNTYNKASGYYATDIYAFDENMNQLACYGTVLNNINSDISNVKTSNKTIKGYTIICNLPTGTDRVAFPTWSSVNNQDDLIWYDGKVKNNNGNLQGEITIDVANHKNDGGLYITHIYAYDKYDKLIASDVSGRATITDRKQITDAKITNVTSNSYKVTCKIPTGTAYVWFPTWTYNNGQDDLICYDAVVNGETAYLTIYKSKHNNESGLYYTHIYAFNSKGEKIGFENVQVSLN